MLFTLTATRSRVFTKRQMVFSTYQVPRGIRDQTRRETVLQKINQFPALLSRNHSAPCKHVFRDQCAGATVVFCHNLASLPYVMRRYPSGYFLHSPVC